MIKETQLIEQIDLAYQLTLNQIPIDLEKGHKLLDLSILEFMKKYNIEHKHYSVIDINRQIIFPTLSIQQYGENILETIFIIDRITDNILDSFETLAIKNNLEKKRIEFKNKDEIYYGAYCIDVMRVPQYHSYFKYFYLYIRKEYKGFYDIFNNTYFNI